MASPTTAFGPSNTHLAAVPWAQRFTLATGKALWVPFLNVTRSLQVRVDQASGCTLAFGGMPAAAVGPVEFDVSSTSPYSEQVQCGGVWLVNRSGSDAAFQVHAILSPDASDAWPAYTVANGFDGVSEATDVTASDAVTLA